MGFLKKLFGGGTAAPDSDFFTFTVKCDRCGETIEGKINLNHDLSLAYEGGFFVRKVLIGSQRCFQQIEATFKFDESRQLQDRQTSGGTFVERS